MHFLNQIWRKNNMEETVVEKNLDAKDYSMYA